MKYSLTLRSAARASDSIAEKHDRLVRGLVAIGGPWGISREPPAAPDLGRELISTLRLDKVLGSKIRGYVAYRYRGGLRDQAMDDDHMVLEFHPDRVDYDALLTGAMVGYIAAFDAYRAELGPADLAEVDFDQARKIDKRRGVYRIYPVSYYGGTLCETAFGLSAARIANLLLGLCTETRLIADGVLLIANRMALNIEESNRFSDAAWQRLRERIS
jgi:hypothetical protein